MVNVYHCFTGVGNLGKSGQDSTLGNVLNTVQLCKPGFTKTHTTLGNIVNLGNGAAYDFVDF